MTMTAEQKAARLELIKKVAQKQKFKQRLQSKGIAPIRKARSYVSDSDRKLDRELARMDENHNQWTDASSYAKEYYGDVAYQTTRYDNDWN